MVRVVPSERAVSSSDAFSSVLGESDSFFGFGAGAGFLYQLSPKLSLDVNAKFSSISSSGSASSYINVMAGVLIAL